MRETQLLAWLEHRRKLLGIESWSALAAQAGLRSDVIEELVCRGSLKGLGRGGRAWLARALKVALQDLEALAAGKISWIERTVDLDRPSGCGGAVIAQRVEFPVLRTVASESGIPVVGHILDDGNVEWLDPSTCGRLPVRVDAQPRAYSLKCKAPAGEEHLIFEPVMGAALGAGMQVVMTLADGTPAGESLFGQLQEADEAAAELICRSPLGSLRKIQLCNIVRTGRLIARV
jgi:hypothetical protein